MTHSAGDTRTQATHSGLALHWLPVARDFRYDLKAALEIQSPAERVRKLASIAQYRLGFLETLQLDRALASLPSDADTGFARVRLALIGSSTLDHLCAGIRVAGLRRNLLIDVWCGGYGQHRQELLDPASNLRKFAPQFVLLSLTASDVVTGISLSASAAEVDEKVARAIDEIKLLWGKAQELKATVIQQNFVNVAETVFGSHDRLVPGAPARIVDRLNDRLADAAGQTSVLLLDIARAAERRGIDAWFDVKRWLQGKMAIAPQAGPLYGDMIGRVIAAQRGLSKKCLVLDLDNTLWGGVVGDVGVEGIILGEGNAQGEAHLALQHYARHLKERGIILAVCSKNDPAIAESAFEQHPEMALKRSDIAVFVANWHDKAENLRAIADRLNIGIDSLVFVDDNPVERARIRESLPMVAVPEMPEDPAHYVRCLADAGYFEAIAFTQDDQQRAEQYIANAQRDELLGTSSTMDDFLRGLDMSVAFGPFEPINLARVTQLMNKTNQFNTTTRRYAAEEISELASAQDAITLQFRLVDRFGDNGLVSAMILRPDPADSRVMEIDNWVMSCRVFGRQLEFEAMNIAVEAARDRGASALCADFVPTAKNGVINELYPSLGFSRINEAEPTNGPTRWMLNLSDYVARSTHIARPGHPT
jgi:FkbH-like protein